ncbi:Uncharacterised protein [uncultured archaeon]|nr:Uncharacterised protein [uncultured archaeon]
MTLPELQSGRLTAIEFYKEGKILSVSGLFKGLYSSLDPLIAFNSSIHNIYADPNASERDAERASLCSDVQARLAEPSGVSAIAYFDTGKRELFEVRRRTNFLRSVSKYPNVFLLASQHGIQFAVREARTYDKEYISPKQMRGAFPCSRPDLYPAVFPKDGQKPLGDKELAFIPEPKLVLGLESFAMDNANIPRVIPDFNLIHASTDSITYLREFLPSGRDFPLSLEAIGKYFGTLHGLGLTDEVDFQEVHYCLGRDNSVVNIDPDFVGFTPFENVLHNSWGRAKRKFTLANLAGGLAQSSRNATFRSMREKFGNRAFLKYIPEGILDSQVLRLTALESFQSD